MVSRLYEKWGISDTTDFGRLKPEDYPILSDLYDLIEEEYQGYDADAHQLYTAELLQEILLGIHSMCKGGEAKFFNGHTNVTSSRFIVFGVKGLLQANRSVRGAMLFNILSFMSDRLLTIGNTTAVLDELYVWLSDMMILFRCRILPLPGIRECLSQTERPSFLPLRLLPVTAQLLPKRRG